MRKFGFFVAAVAMVLTILLTVVADVNHGHGPSAGGHGETTQTAH